MNITAFFISNVVTKSSDARHMINFMDLTKQIIVKGGPDHAFNHFIYDLNAWWPKQYTWSGDDLVEIRIVPEINGLCTEIGPFGFRCDWGRVTELNENVKLTFTWQISPTRIPEPNPDKASRVTILFNELSQGETAITLTHIDFEKHGEDAAGYAEAMDSEQGWPKILGAFKVYCANR